MAIYHPAHTLARGKAGGQGLGVREGSTKDPECGEPDGHPDGIAGAAGHGPAARSHLQGTQEAGEVGGGHSASKANFT